MLVTISCSLFRNPSTPSALEYSKAVHATPPSFATRASSLPKMQNGPAFQAR